METDLAHHAIHQEGGTRHVPGILQQTDEEEEDQDLWQEHHDTADSGDDSVREEIPQITCRHCSLHDSGKPSESGLDPVHRIARDAEDRDEHQDHHPEEGDPTPDLVSQEIVEALGQLVAHGCQSTLRGMAEFSDLLVAGGNDLLPPFRECALQQDTLRKENAMRMARSQLQGQLRRFLLGCGQQHGGLHARHGMTRQTDIGQLLFLGLSPHLVGPMCRDVIRGPRPGARKIGDPGRARNLRPTQCQPEGEKRLPSCCLDRNDRHSQFLRKTFGIHRRPLRAGDVDHVECNDGRKPKLQNLGDEIEIPLQMGGVDHAENTLRSRGVLTEIEEHVAGDPFIGGMGPDAVAARQIEQLDLLAMLADELPRFFFDRDARVIGNLLPETGQRIEERGLAAVGIADDCIRLRADGRRDPEGDLTLVMMRNGNGRSGGRDHVGGKRWDFCRTLGKRFAWLGKHLGGIGRADAELESPKPELHRISQRSTPQECHHGAFEKPHLAQTHRQHALSRKLRDHGTLSGLQRGKGNHWRSGILAAAALTLKGCSAGPAEGAGPFQKRVR